MDDARIDRIQHEADARGKTEFILKVTITDNAGNALGESESIYQLRSPKA